MIEKILMQRDGLSREEAENEIKYTMEMVYDALANGDYEEAEEIWMDNIGLETDYLMMML